MAKIYTRTGDSGQSRLATGQRARKAEPYFAALGDVDELNAHLGIIQTLLSDELTELREHFHQIQNDLFDLGAIVAGADPAKFRITQERISELESLIDTLSADLPVMHAFILPGGNPAGAHLHVARTVCRRAERSIWSLEDAKPGTMPEVATQYINRLSDLLFSAARYVNLPTGGETTWEAPAKH